jgi:hypothetical protein
MTGTLRDTSNHLSFFSYQLKTIYIVPLIIYDFRIQSQLLEYVVVGVVVVEEEVQN